MKLYGLEFLSEYHPKTETLPKHWVRPPVIPEVFFAPQSFLQKEAVVVRSSKKSSPEILILGGESVSMGYMTQILDGLKASYIGVNLDEFVFDGSIEVDLEGEPRLIYGKHTLSLKGIKRVMFLTPQFLMGLDAHPEVLNTEEKIMLSRWRGVIESLVDLMPNADWFPAIPTALYESSQQKLGDLALAKRMGMKVPRTIVTSEPKRAREFYKENKGKVIFREFCTRRVQQRGKLKVFNVEFVKTNSKFWNDIKTSPTIFQQYIEKSMEFRVVVVGAKVFACQIDSQKGSKSKMDWRSYEFDQVGFSIGEIPDALAKKLVLFTRARGLKMASFDLVRDSKGTYYFLEMNRPGAWLFVEALAGLPISRAIASWLT